MPISVVHDPFLLGGKGTVTQIKRKDWELVKEIMRVTQDIPHSTVNPFTSGIRSKETAWKAMDKVLQLWQKVYPDEARLFWDKTAAKAKITGVGGGRDKGMRMLVSAPTGLVVVLRKVFPGQAVSGEEGGKFWREFAKRYPELRVPERI